MKIDNIVVNDILICNSPTTPRQKLLECGITVLEVGEKGIKVLRIHPSHNGETFFMSTDMLEKSNWIKS